LHAVSLCAAGPCRGGGGKHKGARAATKAWRQALKKTDGGCGLGA
jgi:hypothetical protein